MSIIDETYQKAVSDLLQNQTSHGLAAARPSRNLEKATYSSLFPRDIGVSTLGLLTSNDKQLWELAKKSLESLVPSQSKRGQFPQNFIPEKNEIHWWVPGTIDGTLWWSIAFLKYYEVTKDTDFFQKYHENLEKAFTWLTYQDTNNDYLLEQGESAGWDDEMPRFGIVLYTNCLWYYLVKLRVSVEKLTELKDLQNKIHEGVNTILWVHKEFDTNMDYIPKNEYTKKNVYANNMIEISNTKAVYLPYYLGYLSHKTFEMRCDVFANILACLFGVADEKKTKLFIDYVVRAGINLPFPVKVLYPPIYPGEPDWREYMSKGRQNYPWQYHNGGIWPFVGGFWICLLAKYDQDLAKKELEKLALENQLNNYEFNEYLHGQHGTPMGIAHQSWSLAMYLAAFNSLSNPEFL